MEKVQSDNSTPAEMPASVPNGRRWLNNRYNLYQFAERFIIEAVETSNREGTTAVKENLVIERYSTELQLSINNSPIPHVSALEFRQIDGLVGIIQLVSGPYLIAITSSASVGELNGAEIFRVAGTELIPFRTDSHLSEHERRINQILVEMLQNVLACDAFYYSPRMDLSHTLQWLSENSTPDFHQQPLIQRVDRRFVWNAHLCSAFFASNKFSSFVNPLIHGFIGIRRCTINGRNFKLALISRRSIHRAGVRFHTRGLDQEGNCANFVESEQIIEFDMEVTPSKLACANTRHLASFIQMRGSVPLYWSQRPNLKWQPDPSILRQMDEQHSAFRAHLIKLLNDYGREALSGTPRKIVLVNLINQYGREHTLGTHFRSVAEKSIKDNVKFVAFDFHRHCRSLNWDRLALLKSELEADIKQFGFFCTQLGWQPNGDLVESLQGAELRHYQNGFFRTNCMDCLDRTNVVQALLAMESLRLQLQQLGILDHSAANFDAWPDFIYIFKNLWADNGDDCSKQYAGTAALKTDYTRMGKRTINGALQDLQNSCTRYLKNNFSDGYRQDAINLFLGNYTVDRNNLPDSIDHTLVNFDANGAAIAGAVFSAAMTILCVLVSENWTATIFWLAIFAAFSAFIWVNGDDFVDQPLLINNSGIKHSNSSSGRKSED